MVPSFSWGSRARSAISVRGAACLSLSLVGGVACGSSSPTPVPIARSATAVNGIVSAEQYRIGGWHLGLPIGAFALAKPDLWKIHSFDVGGRDQVAMTIGSRHPSSDDPMKGSHLVFIGPSFVGREEKVEASFIPELVIALGEKALEVFEPALPPLSLGGTSLGDVNFVVEKEMENDTPLLQDAVQDPSIDLSQRKRLEEELRTRPVRPKALRLECHTSRVSTVAVDGRALGYVLGEVARNSDARFYKGLRRLVETHLQLR
jgi:hypothetical protein